MKNPLVIFGVLIVVGFIGVGWLMLSSNSGAPSPASSGTTGGNVSIVNGQQVIEITAKGGYLPRVSNAKAGIPTILRFNTKGTFDCSSQVRIPSMKISKSLPSSGTTDIALGELQPGVLNGTCGMGMYPFEIDAQS
ncbi:MAG: cupredoxin domain-containing protein [Candidatus Moraniibacteriota bacterium]